jgi:ribosomal protein S18 acetylase RimI-like enzyme
VTIPAKGDFEVVRLAAGDLADLTGLQEVVLRSLGDSGWLRANTPEMLHDCLVAHDTFGVRSGGQLVGAAVLFDGGRTKENIAGYFTEDSETLRQSVNLKVVFTSPSVRRTGLAQHLVGFLLRCAAEQGYAEVFCTVHPENLPSQRLFHAAGFTTRGRVLTAYGPRDVLSHRFSDFHAR